MSHELFTSQETPFNLAGEALDNSTTQEGEARVRAIAQREARKGQHLLDLDTLTNVPFDLPMNDEEEAAFYREQEWEMAKIQNQIIAQILKPFTPEKK